MVAIGSIKESELSEEVTCDLISEDEKGPVIGRTAETDH